MHRFYIEQINGDVIKLTDPTNIHRIRDVLRLKAGDAVIIFDKSGREYQASINAVGKKQVELKLTPLHTPRSRNINLTIACAVPKGKYMDDIIDYLTQLGVARIIPMLTDRVVVRPDTGSRQTKLLRWRKIAQSAAQQCQRRDIPVISPVADVEEVIKNSQDFDLKLIPHLSGKRTLIKDILASSQPKNIIVLIGPEGDFTSEEVELALHNGFTPVSLGDTVLRVATAAIAVTTYIRFALAK